MPLDLKGLTFDTNLPDRVPSTFRAESLLSVNMGKPSGTMTDTVSTQAYIDRSMDAVRAQNDARFADVLSEVRAINVKLDHVPTTRTMVSSIIGGIVAAVTIGIGAFALFGASFNNGFSLSNIRAAEERIDREQNERIDAILTRMDAFIASQEPVPTQPSPQQ